ncbi:hypothetical protein ACTFIR_002431 [Dictyostelium discoideum]
MKIILILSIFLICFLQFRQSIIDPSQNEVMSDLLFNLYGYDKSLDPCDYQSIECVDINSTSTFQTVIDLNLGEPLQEYVITQDLTPLQNLTCIELQENIKLTSTFFNNVYKLSQLQKIVVGSLNATIPDDTIFPASLETFTISNPSAPLGRAIFESTILHINIYSPLIGYSIPTLINVNSYLLDLELPATFYSGFPSNLSQVFPNLQYLGIQHNFSITNNGVFNNLKHLQFEFSQSDNPQEFSMHTFLSNVPAIIILSIYGQGAIIDPSVGIIDLSYIKPENSLQIKIDTCSILNNCKDICLKLPKNARFTSNFSTFSYDTIDFSNISYFSDHQNDYEQNLPNIDNAPLLAGISISQSVVVGDIPKSYCRINNFNLAHNQLNGTVPSCIQCIGGDIGDWVLPNPFLNFNKTTEPYCPNFKIDQNYKKLVSNDGSGKLIITGTSLGWYGTNLFPIIAYSKLGITIPRGVGTNKSIDVTFQNGEQRTFNYSYLPPFIKSYAFLELDGQNYFTINGTGFDFDNSNSIIINGQQFKFSEAWGGGHYDCLITLNIEELPNFATESKFTVSALVGGQSSNKVTFYYFNSINITEEKLVLNNTGGSVDINGSFGTNKISLVSVSINGTNCLVTSYKNSKLTIQYPSKQVGNNYVLTLNVGGYAVNLVVEYIEGGETPTPTQSPGDDGSTSSTLSISFYLITLLLLIQQFI